MNTYTVDTESRPTRTRHLPVRTHARHCQSRYTIALPYLRSGAIDPQLCHLKLSSSQNVLPANRAVLRLPLPLLSTCSRSLPGIRSVRTPHHDPYNTSGVRLLEARPDKQLRLLFWRPNIFRLWILQQQFPRELLPSTPVKSIVFGNGLLCVAFSTAVDVRVCGLGLIPLLLQGQAEKMVTFPPPLTALVAVCRPRPYYVNFGSSRTLTQPLDPLASRRMIQH